MNTYTAHYLNEDGTEVDFEDFEATDDQWAVRAVLWSDLLLEEDVAGWTLFEDEREVSPGPGDYTWSPDQQTPSESWHNNVKFKS